MRESCSKMCCEASDIALDDCVAEIEMIVCPPLVHLHSPDVE